MTQFHFSLVKLVTMLVTDVTNFVTVMVVPLHFGEVGYKAGDG